MELEHHEDINCATDFMCFMEIGWYNWLVLVGTVSL